MSLKKAKLALTAEQEEYRGRRAAAANVIRAKLPRAQRLADEIRGVFMSAMEASFTSGGEDVFRKASVRSAELQLELAGLLTGQGFEPDALYDLPMCRECADTGRSGPGDICGCLKKHMKNARETEFASLIEGSFGDFKLSIFSPDVEPGWGLSQRENMEANLAYCRGWAKKFSPRSPDLFLNGGTGQGKTFMCACVARKVSEMGFSVKYVTAVSMFREFEDRHFDRGTPDVDIYYNSDLLIIDDLGTEMTTAFVQSALYDVINTRLTSGKKTIVNANLTANELNARYMPQICSRLSGGFKQLHFFGPDLRLR